MARWWRRYLDWRQRHVRRIELSPAGFTILAQQETVPIEWASIDKIVAYKRDLYTVDQLCLMIVAGDTVAEISEDFVGYAAFDAAMHGALGMSPDWKLTVLFPAFQTNAREIFARRGDGAMAAK